MDNERNERRARMLEKVRKLLAMGRDGRGNENEAEIAMRQANRLMAEFGIAEAECDMTAINAGEMSFGETQCGADGRAPEQGKVYRSMPGYAGVLAIGVGRFTDSIVGRKRTEHGEMLYFRGEKQDVLLARWLFGVLVASIQSEQRKSGWTARGDAGSFRMAAASTLARRLKDLAAERRAMYTQAATSGSRALMVVDRKASEIVARFGVQKTRSSSVGYRSSGAAMAGGEAGKRINIPAGRPLGNASRTMIQ
jgi:hypothetical protein